MKKSEQIASLLKKANDSSLSDNERESSKKMAEKLISKHVDTPTRKWSVRILKKALSHKEYDKRLALPLTKLGGVLVLKEGVQAEWIIKDKELAMKTEHVMFMLALEASSNKSISHFTKSVSL